MRRSASNTSAATDNPWINCMLIPFPGGNICVGCGCAGPRGWKICPRFGSPSALTLTETVGASILALPIALAGVGPLAGVVLLLVLGLVNLVTIIGIVEAITRNGNMRYGNTYFGRLVSDYLGDFGRAILTPALLALSVVVLLAYYIGISTTLADATTIPSAWWAALIFLVGVYFLRRESIDATVASALIVGAILPCSAPNAVAAGADARQHRLPLLRQSASGQPER